MLVGLVDELVEIQGIEGERMVWISEWRIWSPIEIGLRHLSMLTARPMRGPDDPDFHCYLLKNSEWKETIALLSIPLLYGWDAYLLVEGGLTLTRISHDSWVSFAVAADSSLDTTRVAAWRPNDGSANEIVN
jgi:hypothetical protein